MLLKRCRGISRVVNYLLGCILVGSAINLTINWRSSDIQGRAARLVKAALGHAVTLPATSGIGLTTPSSFESTTESWRRFNETLEDISVFRFPEFNRYSDYILRENNTACFKEGTHLVQKSPTSCQCKDGWHGVACSIPSVVFYAATPWKKDSVVLRREPRRILQAFPFNMEFEMLEIRLGEIADVVDVFLILESNYTAYGTNKRLYFKERLDAGRYSNVSHKIVYVLLDYFPEAAKKDGWIADALHRNHIGTYGLKLVKDWRMDDLFVLTDADEVPSRESLLFLKWHDGYTEPVTFTVGWFVYGFFWSPDVISGLPKTQTTVMCVTMAMVVYVFRNQVYSIRSAPKFVAQHQLDANLYLKMGGRIGAWTVGNETVTAGWHCSWCLDVERIRNKLVSAQNGDFPRWGDYPAKCNTSYIRSLVAKGLWFDDTSAMKRVRAEDFAPRTILDNAVKYSHLLRNQYAVHTATVHTATVHTATVHTANNSIT